MCGVYVCEVCVYAGYVRVLRPGVARPSVARPGVARPGVAGCVTRPAVACPNRGVSLEFLRRMWDDPRMQQPMANLHIQAHTTYIYTCEKYTNTSTHIYTYTHSHASHESSEHERSTGKGARARAETWRGARE